VKGGLQNQRVVMLVDAVASSLVTLQCENKSEEWN
jgi:hypothetical protein